MNELYGRLKQTLSSDGGGAEKAFKAALSAAIGKTLKEFMNVYGVNIDILPDEVLIRVSGDNIKSVGHHYD